MKVWGEGVHGKPLYLHLNFSVNLKTAIKNKVFNFLKVYVIIHMFCFIMIFSQKLCKVVSCIYPYHIFTNEESDAQIC